MSEENQYDIEYNHDLEYLRDCYKEEAANMVDACRKIGSRGIELLFKFLAYQVAFILDESQMILLNKSRQIGGSFITSYKVIRSMIRGVGNKDWIYFSRSESVAKDFITSCAQWLQLFNVIAETEIVSNKDIQALQLKLPNGARLLIVSSSVNSVVSRSCNFVLDEFALVEDGELLYGYVRPALLWGNRLVIISTMRSKLTYFYKLVKEIEEEGNPKKFSYHKINIEDAIEDGLVDRINIRRRIAGLPEQTPEEFLKELEDQAASPALFRQEFYCEASDSLDENLAFPDDLLIPCTADINKIRVRFANKKRIYLGFDVGEGTAMGDPSVLWVFAENKEKLGCIKYEMLREMPLPNQETWLDEKFKFYNPVRLTIDGSYNPQLAQRFQQKYGKRVKMIKLGRTCRREIIGNYIDAMRNNVFEIPNDEDILEDHKQILKSKDEFNQIFYDIIRNKKRRSHADRAMAGVLAYESYMDAKGKGFNLEALRAAKAIQRKLKNSRRKKRRRVI